MVAERDHLVVSTSCLTLAISPMHYSCIYHQLSTSNPLAPSTLAPGHLYLKLSFCPLALSTLNSRHLYLKSRHLHLNLSPSQPKTFAISTYKVTCFNHR